MRHYLAMMEASMTSPSEQETKTLYAVAAWGVLGFAALLVKALWQLTPLALEPIREHTLSGLQVALYIGWVAFMAYSEGYKGFQRQMAPRVAARGMYAARNPRPALVLLAPLFCMGLIHATKKRLISSWVLLIGIIAAVLLVRLLDQPWRGIVDGGVVVGLGWGLTATLWYFIASLLGQVPDVPVDVPGEPADSQAGANGSP